MSQSKFKPTTVGFEPWFLEIAKGVAKARGFETTFSAYINKLVADDIAKHESEVAAAEAKRIADIAATNGGFSKTVAGRKKPLNRSPARSKLK